VELTYGTVGSAPNRLLSVTDANPSSGYRRSLLFDYSSNGDRLVKVTDPLQRHWDFTYVADGLGQYYFNVVTYPKGPNDPSDPRTLKIGNTTGHLLAYFAPPDQNTTFGAWTTEYGTEYDIKGRGIACLGRSGLGVRGMHGLYLAYGEDTVNGRKWAVSWDQTHVVHKTTFL
jgi:hypothetical protein